MKSVHSLRPVSLAVLCVLLLAASPMLALTAAEDAFDHGDYSRAAKLWMQDAERGDAQAQWMVGWLHDRGDRGLAKDSAEANRWYRKAIRGEEPAALWNRGLAAAWGKAGATRSLRVAESWFRRAADRGGAEFQTRLGQCYQGESLPPCGLRADFARAKRYLDRAAGETYAGAFCGLAELYEGGRGVIRSQRTADEYTARAQAQGAPCGEVARVAVAAGPPLVSEAQVRRQALVAEVQSQLARLGLKPGPVDGQSGRKTRSAIFDFQTRSGMTADGVPSGELLAELLRTDPASLGGSLLAANAPLVSSGGSLAPLTVPGEGFSFGRYRALVIGNDEYEDLPGLGTAGRDAEAVAEVLKSEYGFEVDLVRNATRTQLLAKFATLRNELGPDDNLLVYYAGHGWYDEESERGYWLPVDAAKTDRANWISNGALTDDLKAMEAKHVMVVADSCYSGTWTRALNLRDRGDDYLTRIARKRARVVLASGNLEPVSDRGGRGHSVFARAFLDVLRENDGVLDGTQLFSQIRRPVMLDSDQTPQYGDIRNAGHGGGDFLFVRTH